MNDRWLLRLLVALVALLIAAAAGWATLDAAQRHWIFQPNRDVAGPGWAGDALAYEDVWIPQGREQVHGWWFAHPDGAGAPSLLYLHGARWNLAAGHARVRRMVAAGYNVLAIDYRGFGRSSELLPSERSSYDDANAAWSWLATREPDAARRFVYGHSLGGAIAIDLASRRDDVGGVIVEGTFTSIGELVVDRHAVWMPRGAAEAPLLHALLASETGRRWMPTLIDAVLRHRFDSLSKLPKVRAPLLVIHGTRDWVVPHAMADRLYAAAAGPKTLLKIDGATHRSVPVQGADAYADALRRMITAGPSCPSCRASSSRVRPSASSSSSPASGRTATAGG